MLEKKQHLGFSGFEEAEVLYHNSILNEDDRAVKISHFTTAQVGFLWDNSTALLADLMETNWTQGDNIFSKITSCQLTDSSH